MDKTKAVYSMGRIYSKYIILNIFSYGFDFSWSAFIISLISPKYRKLIVQNHKLFLNHYPEHLVVRCFTDNILDPDYDPNSELAQMARKYFKKSINNARIDVLNDPDCQEILFVMEVK